MIEILGTLSALAADYLPLLSSTGIVLVLVLWLQPSIKKHAKVYYWVFGLIAFFVLSSVVVGTFGGQSPPIRKVPVLRDIFALFSSIKGLSLPLLVIIMYMGALDTKHRTVAKLMSIRKELSILSGFSVLCHATIRIIHIIPSTFRFFFTNEKNEMMHGESVSYAVQLMMHSAFFLGLFMTALFLLLWITSFSKVHRVLGGKRWKAIQRWSYLLYGMLFCHSVLLNSAWLLSTLSKDGSVSYILGLVSTVLIFGSYLVLRLLKASRDKKKKRLRKAPRK